MIRFECQDSRQALKQLADESVNCCVTSPPYWSLRDYGCEGQIGCEDTLGAYIAELVSMFGEVRRCLKRDGVLWLNLGDAYNAYNGNRGESKGDVHKNYHNILPKLPRGHGLTCKELKSKDLLGIPWRVAFALQSDGWYLRSDTVWNKPNCRPERVKDRPWKSHEYVFLLTKSQRYFFKHTEKKSVWTIASKAIVAGHPATFPIELAKRLIESGCPERGVVLDPFAGVGTTLLAAQSCGRDAIGFELNQTFVSLGKAAIGL